jgi:putative ABC transport system permease protein
VLLTIAARNLARNLRRTAITVSAIAFGLMTIHFVIGLATGQYFEMIRVGVSQLAGHVVVQGPGYQDKLDGDIVVSDARAVVDTLTGAFPGARVAPRMALGGLLVSPTGSVGAALQGLDFAVERDIQEVDDKLVEGVWLDGDGRGLVVGYKLAETLSVGVGDKLVYMGQHDGATEMGSRLFRIKGIFRTGAVEQDAFLAYADLPAVQEVFGWPDVANRITVHLQAPSRESVVAAEALASERLAARRDLDVRTWWEALPEIYGFIQLDKNSSNVMLSVLGVIVAMGVLNTMLMSVMERTREFGVLLALGTAPGRLAGLILLEATLIGVLGAVFGSALGAAVVWYFNVNGLDYTGMLGVETIDSMGVAISAVLRPMFNWPRMLGFTVGAVAFTAVAAVYPALYVAWLRPVDALRHV